MQYTHQTVNAEIAGPRSQSTCAPSGTGGRNDLLDLRFLRHYSWRRIMIRLLATLLLICFGTILPVAAAPVRVCLLEQKQREADCCKKCHDKHQDCCAELDKLPDSPMPGGSLEIPPFVAWEIPSFDAAVRPVEIVVAMEPRYAPPIRGPGTPAAVRSVLSVWSI